MKMIRESKTWSDYDQEWQNNQSAFVDDEALFSLYAIRFTRPAPLDSVTELPLPIFPAEYTNEWHHDQHHAFYPKVSPLLRGISGNVLRHSRLQYGNADLHSEYHYLYDGVQVPVDPQKRFGAIVLACAGYIPETAIDVRGRNPLEVRLDQDLRRYMQQELIYAEKRMSHRTNLDINNSHRGIYLMNYALNQGFDHIRQSLLEEFLETTDADKKLKLGMFIVDMSFNRAVSPIRNIYDTAHKKGYIHPSKRKNPVGLIREIVQEHQPHYFDTLQERIIQDVAA
jgi:hypothetical protein